MSNTIRPGDVIAGRYRMGDLLGESAGGLFWRAHDQVLDRYVAFHVIPAADSRSALLLDAARRSATVVDSRILRVLDADRDGDICFVVNEWGSGTSLDLLLQAEGPLGPRRAAWIASEVADTIAIAHARGEAHGRLVPENVLIDHNGSVKIIGFAVDAALHGLPAGRRSTDVVDLAGILYAALVGKWPGVSRSSLPPAPQAGGRPLRPRKVRAGVPRSLDSICDRVLNPYGQTNGEPGHDVTTAAGLQAALVEFVGDPGALAAAEASHPPVPRTPSVRPDHTRPDPDATLTALPAHEAAAEQVTAQVPAAPATEEPTEEPTPAPDDASHPAEAEADPQATVAGAPPLDAHWSAPREDTPPPPPAFEQPPERPLYAPDPVRRPRQPVAPPSVSQRHETGDFWPWQHSTGTGSGMIPVTEDDAVPGRSWLRLAWGLAAVVLLLTAVVFAFNLGRDRPVPEETTPSESPSSPTQRTLEVLTVATAEDFDPEGDPPEENPEDAGNVVDDDPATTWTTSTYDDQLGPGGLKTGVGVLLDLGTSQPVSQVDLRLVGSPTGVQLFVLDELPTDPPAGDPGAEGTADGETLRLRPAGSPEGRYVVVWLTELPEVGGFRGEIAEIVVRS